MIESSPVDALKVMPEVIGDMVVVPGVPLVSETEIVSRSVVFTSAPIELPRALASVGPFG